MRAPEGTDVGSVRRVNISNLVAYDADPRYGSIISGIPGHDIEDVKLSDIRIVYRGGLTLDQVAKQPPDLVNTFFFRATGGVPPREPYATPEREKEYPEPSMFGMLPAYGFFIRHATGIGKGSRFSACQGAEGVRRPDVCVAERGGFFGSWFDAGARRARGEGGPQRNVRSRANVWDIAIRIGTGIV